MKKKSKKSLEQVQESKPVEIQQDLIDKLGAIRALAGCYNLLNGAAFPVGHHESVVKSLAFLQELHKQALQDALQHPQAGLVEELKQFTQPVGE